MGEKSEVSSVGREAVSAVSYEAVVTVYGEDGEDGPAVVQATFASAAEARAWVLSHATITKVVRKVVA